jgi:hypothetical protein
MRIQKQKNKNIKKCKKISLINKIVRIIIKIKQRGENFWKANLYLELTLELSQQEQF